MRSALFRKTVKAVTFNYSNAYFSSQNSWPFKNFYKASYIRYLYNLWISKLWCWKSELSLYQTKNDSRYCIFELDFFFWRSWNEKGTIAIQLSWLLDQKYEFHTGGAYFVGIRLWKTSNHVFSFAFQSRLFSIWIGQERIDQSKFRMTLTKKQNQTRELTSSTAFYRLNWQPRMTVECLLVVFETGLTFD